jgi:hypothetical protein
VLRDHDPAKNLSFPQLVEWISQTVSLPYQADLSTDFGQPRVTVYNGNHFFIDLLFWADGTTSIHQHGFSGAFQVVEGSSLQSTYSFRCDRKVAAHLLLGELRFLAAEYLPKGSIRSIHSGKGLIHSVFHLERPSLTIVIRTARDVENQPQYAYCKPHVAYDPFYQDPCSVRRLQLLDTLLETRYPQVGAVACHMIRESDLFTAYEVLRRVYFWFPSHTEEFSETVREARVRYDTDVDLLLILQRKKELAVRDCLAMLRARS